MELKRCGLHSPPPIHLTTRSLCARTQNKHSENLHTHSETARPNHIDTHTALCTRTAGWYGRVGNGGARNRWGHRPLHPRDWHPPQRERLASAERSVRTVFTQMFVCVCVRGMFKLCEKNSNSTDSLGGPPTDPLVFITFHRTNRVVGSAAAGRIGRSNVNGRVQQE